MYVVTNTSFRGEGGDRQKGHRHFRRFPDFALGHSGTVSMKALLNKELMS